MTKSKPRLLHRLLSGLIAFACLLLLPLGATAESPAPPTEEVEDYIVKVHVTSRLSDSISPWNSTVSSGNGSGFIIEGKRVLTNAHVVADSTFIELQRDGHPKRFEAEVEAVSHETDLALLKVKDDTFFADSGFLPLGDLPEVHQEVTVYGYPVGGEALSITKGIVSRIEFHTYSHSRLSLQAIQVDAAINSGNSGGPALSAGKVVGIAMQMIAGNNVENLGYLIPVTMVKRFLTDLADGKQDGLPALSVQTADLLNPTLKKHYQLPEGVSGVLVTNVCANTPAEKVLQANDVITHIDGKKIEDNSMTMLTPNKYINFMYHTDLHQVGDKLKLDIVRSGNSLQVEVPLTKTLKSTIQHDKDPTYFVYGGFVFTLVENPDYCQSRKDFDKEEHKNRQEYVNVAQVLAAPSNIGFHNTSDFYIEKINGKTFDTFKAFHALLKADSSPYILLENLSGEQLAIDRKQADESHQALIRKYLIQKAQSDDVSLWEQGRASTPQQTVADTQTAATH